MTNKRKNTFLLVQQLFIVISSTFVQGCKFIGDGTPSFIGNDTISCNNSECQDGIISGCQYVHCSDYSCKDTVITGCSHVHCTGEKSCTRATIEDIQDDGKVYCDGELSCWKADIGGVDAVLAENAPQPFDVYCTEYAACFKSKINSRGGSVTCSTTYSCAETIIETESLTCNSPVACASYIHSDNTPAMIKAADITCSGGAVNEPACAANFVSFRLNCKGKYSCGHYYGTYECFHTSALGSNDKQPCSSNKVFGMGEQMISLEKQISALTKKVNSLQNKLDDCKNKD